MESFALVWWRADAFFCSAGHVEKGHGGAVSIPVNHLIWPLNLSYYCYDGKRSEIRSAIHLRKHIEILANKHR